MRSRVDAWCLLVVLGFCLIDAGRVWAVELVNVAAGKPYTFSVSPNYSHCTDEGDATDLTDGSTAEQMDWVKKSTVGWTRPTRIQITIDLGRVEPICGVAYYGVAGSAGICWPGSILVSASEDGGAFYEAGELYRLAEDPLPRGYGYSTYAFRTRALQTKGRYVRFDIVSAGSYVFLDELEVYRGDAAWVEHGYEGQPIADDYAVDKTRLTKVGVYRRLRRDLEATRREVEAASLDGAPRKRLLVRLDDLTQELSGSDYPDDVEAFRAILPFNDLHRKIFQVRSAALAAKGAAAMTVWHTHRYDIMDLFEPVGDEVERINLAMMENERRVEVFNLTNASTVAQRVRLKVEGLPGGTNPDYVRVYEVAFVDEREGVANGLALLHLARRADRYETTVEAGMTRQIWVDVDTAAVSAGNYAGKVTLTGQGWRKDLGFDLSVAPVRMADKPSCSLTMWDYVYTLGYAITPENQAAAVLDMREHLVDAPWAHSSALPQFEASDFDAAGSLVGELDFAKWDGYVKMFPWARYYFVFAAYRANTHFAGRAPGTAEFDRAVGQWAAAWAAHNREMGIQPGQAAVLFLDEPGDAEWFRTAYQYSKAVKAGTDEITVFNDPAGRHVLHTEYGRELLQYSDIICPTLASYKPLSGQDKEEFRKLTRQGKQLWFYMCSGPGHLVNPAYYRLQTWFNFEAGGSGTGFWSYASPAADVWNDYGPARSCNYAPGYVGLDSVTNSVQFEALRESILDYEYLTMLRDRIEQLQQMGADGAVIARAQGVLDSALATVMVAEGKDNPCFYADQGRLKVLAVLSELAH